MATTSSAGTAAGAREPGVWFVYDGDCPICGLAAKALRVKAAAGPLALVDARTEPDHPVLAEVNAQGFDLDSGMVLKVGSRLYGGEDALHLMALLGSGSGWFNRINAVLFKSKRLARVAYPLMRAGRNALLRLRGIGKLRNLASFDGPRPPILATVLGPAWDDLPPVMKAHYAVRAYSNDSVTMRGALDVTVSWPVALTARLTGTLVPWSGTAVPVEVRLHAEPGSAALHFDRRFAFPGRREVRFRSRMEPAGGGEMIEFMRFGIGWRLAYGWDGDKIVLAHRGYVCRVLGLDLPLPLAWILGRGHAEEAVLSDTGFAMWTHALHPWFGRTFGYAGRFEVAEATCATAP